MYTDIRRVSMSLQSVTTNLKRKRKLTVDESASLEASDTAADKITDTTDNDVEKSAAPSPVPMKQRRHRFISVKEFNQLVEDASTDRPVEWCKLKRDRIYKVCDIDKLRENVVVILLDQQRQSYVVLIPLIVLKMIHNKLESVKGTAEVYLRPKDGNNTDIVIKETFPCRYDCGEEFHSNHGRWSHHKHCIKRGT